MESREVPLIDESGFEERDVAHAIQQGALPARIPQVAGWHLEACYQPADEVGGDYYDFIPIDADHLGVVVADVSAKGIAGAMVTTLVRNSLHALALKSLSPGAVLDQTEHLLVPRLAPDMFVSIFYGVLGWKDRVFHCANAGHLPLLTGRRGGPCRWVRPRGHALGVGSMGSVREEAAVPLAPGEFILLMTDGVTERRDADESFFGRGRVQSYLESCPAEGPVIPGLCRELENFSPTASQDDVTAVFVERLAEPPKKTQGLLSSNGRSDYVPV